MLFKKEGRSKQKKNAQVEQALMEELKELKAEVAAVKERVRTPPQAQNSPHNSLCDNPYSVGPTNI